MAWCLILFFQSELSSSPQVFSFFTLHIFSLKTYCTTSVKRLHYFIEKFYILWSSVVIIPNPTSNWHVRRRCIVLSHQTNTNIVDFRLSIYSFSKPCFFRSNTP